MRYGQGNEHEGGVAMFFLSIMYIVWRNGKGTIGDKDEILSVGREGRVGVLEEDEVLKVCDYRGKKVWT